MMSSSSRNTSKIAVAQLCSTSSKFRNMLNVAKCAAWASREKASMLFLPECFGFLGNSAEETLANAEETPAPSNQKKNAPHITRALVATVTTADCDTSTNDDIPDFSQDQDVLLLDALRTIAVAGNLWISAGGMHVIADNMNSGRSKVYNTHIILDNTGEIRAEYQKIHLFDVSIPGRFDLRESKTTKAGTKLVVCPNSPIGKRNSYVKVRGCFSTLFLIFALLYFSFQAVWELQFATT